MKSCPKHGPGHINGQGRCRPCWATYMRSWSDKNRDAVRERNRVYKQAFPDKYRDSKLRHLFGITLDQYNAMLAKQGGVCASCGQKRGKRRLAVDHHHGTGRVRGLLCSPCNTALGLLEEDHEMISRLSEYLKRTEAS